MKRLELSWRVLAAALLLAGYGWFLVRHTAFAVGGSDSSGYINTARRMGSGTLLDRPRALEQLALPDDMVQVFIPLGFVAGPRPGTMAPLYPSGFPAHMLVAARVLGWNRGPFLLSPLSAVLCLLLFYALCRELSLPKSWAAAGAVILALWPVFLFQAIQPMSDVVATVWSLATIVSALKARRRRSWALAAGAAWGIAVLVRPTNLLLAVPLAFALPLSASSLALLAAGGAPFAAAVAAYDIHCYGDALQTGYGKSGFWSGMAIANFPPRFRHYGSWILRSLTPIVPLAWLGLAVDRKTARQDRLLLFAWFGCFFLFYCFYEPYDSFIFVRFLLPGVPALLAGALLAGRHALERIRRQPQGAVIGSLLLFLVILAEETASVRRVGVFAIVDGQSIYPRSCAWAAAALPPKSIVLTMAMSGAMEYYTRLSYARWDWLEPDRFARLRGLTETAGYHWYALLFPFEAAELRRHAPAAWREIGRIQDVVLLEIRD